MSVFVLGPPHELVQTSLPHTQAMYPVDVVRAICHLHRTSFHAEVRLCCSSNILNQGISRDFSSNSVRRVSFRGPGRGPADFRQWFSGFERDRFTVLRHVKSRNWRGRSSERIFGGGAAGVEMIASGFKV